MQNKYSIKVFKSTEGEKDVVIEADNLSSAIQIALSMGFLVTDWDEQPTKEKTKDLLEDPREEDFDALMGINEDD